MACLVDANTAMLVYLPQRRQKPVLAGLVAARMALRLRLTSGTG